jgi:hypothetical protein
MVPVRDRRQSLRQLRTLPRSRTRCARPLAGQQATGECGDAERGVGHPVLGREDATADLLRRARLDERQCCDVPERPANAGERDPGEADRKDRGGARQRQPGGARAERGDEDARPVWQVRADISADPELAGARASRTRRPPSGQRAGISPEAPLP